MSGSEGSGAGQREVAYRIFAAEFETADYDYSESDEERAPNYVITPTGARANRLFIVGVLTEIEQVSEDVLRARVVDPTGAFVLYAGQYQPDEQAFLERADSPAFVAVTGKARTFQPEDSDRVFTSVRPESISEIDAETRDRWTVQTAEQTIDRIRWMTAALTLDGEDLRAQLRQRGADDGLAHGIELALDHYGTTPTYLDALREMSLDAARVVAGGADEVPEFTTSPDASGDVTVADLAAKFTLPEADEQPARETAEISPAESETEPTADSTAEKPASATESDGSTETAAEGAGETVIDEPAAETTEPATETTEQPPASEDSPRVDSDPAESEADSGVTAEPDELGDFEPEEFELEEETREEIEEEFGTDFQSGTEVEEPGNADIETPDPEDLDQREGGSADGEPVESEPAAEDDTGDDPAAAASGPAGERSESVEDPQQAVVDLMSELDDGNGAEREQLVAEMGARYGIDSEAVEDAIQSALMEGQCYEPDDERLKPI
jgi:RPA family protein